jgi:dipeptidyl aminopeptidase/acylaminoacyl peptidase
MLHGGQDTTSTTEDVLAIQESLRSNGVPCQVTVFDDDTHGLTRHRREMFSQMFHFLRQFE